MKVLSAEVLTEEQATNLRRLARHERRAEKERYLSMTGHHVLALLQADLSEFRLAIRRDDAPEESAALPWVASDEVGEYEKREEIALLFLAQENTAKPVLVRFVSTPGKSFEDRLRHSARIRNLRLRFFRVTDEWVVLEVHPGARVGRKEANSSRQYS